MMSDEPECSSSCSDGERTSGMMAAGAFDGERRLETTAAWIVVATCAAGNASPLQSNFPSDVGPIFSEKRARVKGSSVFTPME